MINLSYKTLGEYYIPIVQYATRICDAFGLVFHSVWPYKLEEPIIIEKEFAKELEPYLINQTIRALEWPGTVTKKIKQYVLNVYRCCKGSREVLLKVKNITNFYSIMTALPEDLHFLRKNEAWLVTVMHENLAYICNETEEDIKFFQELNIPITVYNKSKTSWHAEYDINKAIP